MILSIAMNHVMYTMLSWNTVPHKGELGIVEDKLVTYSHTRLWGWNNHQQDQIKITEEPIL